MITVRLKGGLGNQMFQYAAGRRAAIHNNTQLKLDISYYNNQIDATPRRYELNIFPIKARVCSKLESEVYGVVRKVASMFGGTIPYLNQLYVKQKDHNFDKKILNVGKYAYLDGWWARVGYFNDIESTIREDFRFLPSLKGHNLLLATKIKNHQSVSVHLRRGDYVTDNVTNKFHGVSSEGYYKKAISYIKNKEDNPVFFIFSDDIKWCKDNFTIPHKTIYIDVNSPDKGFEDMRLMSLCKHNIIANSSFSWWGAWLNNNPGKIVIAPRKWLRSIIIDTQSMFPNDWISL